MIDFCRFDSENFILGEAERSPKFEIRISDFIKDLIIELTYPEVPFLLARHARRS